MAIAGFRERASSLAVARGVLARHEPEIRHQLSRGSEAPPIDEFGHENHRCVELPAAETLQPLDRGGRDRCECPCCDLAIECVPARQFVLEEPQILSEDTPVFERERRGGVRESPQPFVVRGAQIRAFAIDEAALGEKLQDVMPTLRDVTLKGLAATHDVVHALLGLAGNADHGELARPVEWCALDRVVCVMLARHTGLRRDERGAITSPCRPHVVIAGCST